MAETRDPEWAASVLDTTLHANPEEVQAAFREKAKNHHPDVSTDPNADREFRKIMEARTVLMDAVTGDSSLGKSEDRDSERWESRADTAEPESAGADDNGHAHTASSSSANTATDAGGQDVSDNSVWEGWQEERKDNERRGESRYRRPPPEDRWSSPGERRSRRERTSRRGQTGGYRSTTTSPTATIAALFRSVTVLEYASRVALILGIAVALLPFGIAGTRFSVPITSTAGFLCVAGGLTVGTTAQLFLSSAAQSRRRHSPTTGSGFPAGAVAVANVVGVSLAAIAYTRGYPLGGIQFVAGNILAALIPAVLGGILGVYLAQEFWEPPAGAPPNAKTIRIAAGGLIGGLGAMCLGLMRTGSHSLLGALGFPSSAGGGPWLAQLTAGVFSLTTPINFVVGLIMSASVLGSFAVLCWFYPLFRSLSISSLTSRYGAAKHLVVTMVLTAIPSVLFWMLLTGRAAVEAGSVTLPRVAFVTLVLLYPTVLSALYATASRSDRR